MPAKKKVKIVRAARPAKPAAKRRTAIPATMPHTLGGRASSPAIFLAANGSGNDVYDGRSPAVAAPPTEPVFGAPRVGLCPYSWIRRGCRNVGEAARSTVQVADNIAHVNRDAGETPARPKRQPRRCCRRRNRCRAIAIA